MSFFEMRKEGIAVSDVSVASALLCPALFWGNDDKSRALGPDPNREFKPGTLKFVERYVKPGSNAVRVVFYIGGDSADLRYRRYLFHTGSLFVNGKEYRKNRELLIEEIHKARRENPYAPERGENEKEKKSV